MSFLSTLPELDLTMPLSYETNWSGTGRRLEDKRTVMLGDRPLGVVGMRHRLLPLIDAAEVLGAPCRAYLADRARTAIIVADPEPRAGDYQVHRVLRYPLLKGRLELHAPTIRIKCDNQLSYRTLMMRASHDGTLDAFRDVSWGSLDSRALDVTAKWESLDTRPLDVWSRVDALRILLTAAIGKVDTAQPNARLLSTSARRRDRLVEALDYATAVESHPRSLHACAQVVQSYVQHDRSPRLAGADRFDRVLGRAFQGTNERILGAALALN